MKIGIMGCGLIGEKRGLQVSPHRVVGVYDPAVGKAQKLAGLLNCQSFTTEDEFFKSCPCDIVIIATTNQNLAPSAQKAISHGKAVLVEKPGAISVSELEEIRALSLKKKTPVKVGFNHRFHPALLKARELIDQGALGDLMFLRARYGHGGRLGYEKEWRSSSAVAGGGELLDQGIHILDLVFWFMGPLPLQSSLVKTSFWKTEVDDNAVLTLADPKRWATFHVSSSEWKNTFSLEIYGQTGKILIPGLGRSYGKESLIYYKMLPQMGPPEVTTHEFPEGDLSWSLDLKNLVDHMERGAPLLGDLESALYGLKQIRLAYQQNGYKNLPCSV